MEDQIAPFSPSPAQVAFENALEFTALLMLLCMKAKGPISVVYNGKVILHTLVPPPEQPQEAPEAAQPEPQDGQTPPAPPSLGTQHATEAEREPIVESP